MSNNYDLDTADRNNRVVESVALISIPPPVHHQEDDDETLPTRRQQQISDQDDTLVFPAALHKLLPPRGKPAAYLTRCLACFLVWAAIFCVIGKNALPGSNIFSIYILLLAASFGGFLAGWKTRYFHFPPLLGMLVVGFLLRNIEHINIAKDIDASWSSVLRNTALVVILLRSGLGLDLNALKKLKCTMLRLAFIPCILEAVTVAIVSHVLLKLPWVWSFQLG